MIIQDSTDSDQDQTLSYNSPRMKGNTLRQLSQPDDYSQLVCVYSFLVDKN